MCQSLVKPSDLGDQAAKKRRKKERSKQQQQNKNGRRPAVANNIDNNFAINIKIIN